MAATHKLVQQAMHGQWQEVPRTVEQRRELLNQLLTSASSRDQPWLGALQQAMAESDAAVAAMAAQSPAPVTGPLPAGMSRQGTAADRTEQAPLAEQMLEMLKTAR